MNLGWTKEDDPGLVAENRRRFLRSAGGIWRGEDGQETGWKMVTLRQVHSAAVRVVGRGWALEGRLETAEGKAVLEGDGMMTDVPGVMLAVGTADCVPVLVVDVVRRAVGGVSCGVAGHRGGDCGAGNRGDAVRSMGRGWRICGRRWGLRSGLAATRWGRRCGRRLGQRFGYAEELFREADGAMHVDLWEANRRQLLDAGLKTEQIAVVGECTACARDERGERRYFSHRAERGVAGRMLSAVGVVA